jgi:CubicO group peptidase (beta-lactamase class C family)
MLITDRRQRRDELGAKNARTARARRVIRIHGGASPMARPDFSSAHAVLRRHHEERRLSGVSALISRRGRVVDDFCIGDADLERHQPLRSDHIHRVHSNTKLITAVMTLMLVDEGRVSLEEPIKRWIPGFAATRVLRAGAKSLDDTEPLACDITVRHLLTHTAGLSHGVFDPGTMIYDAYAASGVRRQDCSTAMIAERLPALPLLFQPGEGWEYSMAPDVLARLVEIVTGRSYIEALRQRLFDPLGMVDTGYVLREDQVSRMAALYGGNVADPDEPGLRRLDDLPWPGAHLTRVPREAGASGLFSTQADMLALLSRLLPGSGGPLADATLAEMFRDQLPPRLSVQFLQSGPMPALGFGLAGAVTRRPFALQPNTPVGELQWGGVAGTHWAVSPATQEILVLMTQRHMGFWNPFWFEWKAAAYAALRALGETG